MPLYEHIFMSRQDVTPQQVEAVTEQLKGIVEAEGGSFAKIEQWGLKPLAYKVRKNRKAHYTLINIDASPAAVKEMERQMSINEDIIRFLTIRVEEHEEGPSAALQRREERPRRDDRNRRDNDNNSDSTDDSEGDEA